MLRSAISSAAVVLLALSLGACTRFESTYVRKVREADALSKQLSAQQSRNLELSDQNETLKGQVAKLTGDLGSMTSERDRYMGDLTAMTARRDQLSADLAGMTSLRDRLAADNRELEKVLQAKSDSLLQSIAELRRKNAEIEAENARLKQEVARIEQAVSDQARTVARLEGENAKYCKDLDDLRRAEEEKLKKTRTYEELLRKMKGEIEQGQMTITELKGKLTVNMVDAILFDTGKAEVKPEGMEILARVVSILKDVKDKWIRIEGHTDNVQIVGMLAKKYPTNWELSSARAINVARFLQEQGIDPAVLSGVAYGEYHPVAGNETPEGKRKNRRIEIILVPKD